MTDKKIPFEIEHPTKITLFSHPFITLKYLVIVIKDYIVELFKFIIKYWYIFFTISALIILPYKVEGPHTQVKFLIYRQKEKKKNLSNKISKFKKAQNNN